MSPLERGTTPHSPSHSATYEWYRPNVSAANGPTPAREVQLALHADAQRPRLGLTRHAERFVRLAVASEHAPGNARTDLEVRRDRDRGRQTHAEIDPQRHAPRRQLREIRP